MSNLLSLDGGGTWALIEAKTLGQLFGQDTPGRDILRRFDLVISNSGGSIVLAALLANMTPSQIHSSFLDPNFRNTLFVEKSPGWNPINWVLSAMGLLPRFSAEAKYTGLKAFFNHTPGSIGSLSDLPLSQLDAAVAKAGEAPLPPIIIAIFDLNRLREDFAYSRPPPQLKDLSWSSDLSIVELVHGSSNAPILWFDKPARPANSNYNGWQFWDGALGGYNNPVMAGVQAYLLGNPQAQLTALSLGTAKVFRPLPYTNKTLPTPEKDKGQLIQPCTIGDTLAGSIKTAASAISDDPPDTASLHAHTMLGGSWNGNRHVFRLNPLVQPRLLDPADPHSYTAPILRPPSGNNTPETDFQTLATLDMAVTDQNQVLLIDALADAWIKGEVSNQAILAARDCHPIIGESCAAIEANAWSAASGIPIQAWPVPAHTITQPI